MSIKDAVAARFHSLCETRGMKLNELAVVSGVTPSTVYSMMDDRRRDISVLTIKKLCDGLDITITEFFASAEFEDLDPEIL